MIMNSDGTEPVKVTEIGVPFFAEWSWKGDRISYEYVNAPQPESQAGIFIYDLEEDRTNNAAFRRGSRPFRRPGMAKRGVRAAVPGTGHGLRRLLSGPHLPHLARLRPSPNPFPLTTRFARGLLSSTCLTTCPPNRGSVTVTAGVFAGSRWTLICYREKVVHEV